MKKTVAVLLALCAGFACAEGNVTNAKVAELRVDRDGKGGVTFDRYLSNTPAACGQTNPKSLSFDTNTAAGKAIFALLASAQATGKSVTAYGSGTCPDYLVAEGWGFGFQLSQ